MKSPLRKEKRTATSGWNFKCIQNIVNFIFRIQSRFYIIILSVLSFAVNCWFQCSVGLVLSA